ncbi:LacI family DNA-binding transcriptional regulator [Glaciibacter superstes]|uniref:LacI family DNA-binding transcriptional regulator n=1 Tax=Glaciibacter superstes TaxID=501023 RepID=UPI0003B3B8D4|nr:LacI family DNA-binding transcriptional regulator [Glaciibacter superstes]
MTAIPGNRKVTRKDVARYAGVSDAVVSYTLNGGAPVAPATAERVREAVRLLGYTPNASARALKLGSSHMIGVIVPDSTNPFWAELCRWVETVARSKGFAVLVLNANDSKAIRLEYLQTLASRQVDGVLLTGEIDALDVDRFNATGVRWAMLNQSTTIDGALGVGVDLAAGARDATAHLIWHGYTRIAFIGEMADARYGGWLSTLTEAGLAPGPLFDAKFTREGGYAAGQALAASHDSVDAVFVSSDMLASAVLRALHEADLAVPGEIAIASFDGSPESEYSWPALTTVRQPVQDLAAKAVAQLLHREQPPEDEQLLAGTLIVRQSCGCP